MTPSVDVPGILKPCIKCRHSLEQPRCGYLVCTAKPEQVRSNPVYGYITSPNCYMAYRTFCGGKLFDERPEEESHAEET